MSFAQLNLNPDIFKAINHCGYNKPTPIQSKTIPDILIGKDLIAAAQTGTGKTAAFVLPALQLVSEKHKSSHPRILILTPTRELATQITQAVTKYGKFMRVNVVDLVGGMSYKQQLRNLSRPSDIIVATPGRLLDHMRNRRINLSEIEMFVLDEADRMLDMGFIDDVKDIAKATPNNRQTLLFSATINKRVSTLISNLLKNPVHINLCEENFSPNRIKQELYFADNAQHKNKMLLHFLNNSRIFKGIIFCGTKINVDNLVKQFSKQNSRVAALHGDLKQAVRNRTIEQFRRGKIQFLIATDVAARGIDISDVTHIINYDLPKFSEDYVHRIGRTGRAGKSGIAISLVLSSDARHLQKIERFISQKIEWLTIPGLEPTKTMSDAPKKSAPGSRSKKHKKYGSSASRNGSNASKNGSKPNKSHKGSFTQKPRKKFKRKSA